MTGPLWCETFDADLLAVVPGAVEALGDVADLELWTYSTPTNGKINCPASWWTLNGLAAFFSTRDRSPAPPSYRTSDPLVECTFLEAVRDEWVHGAIVVVNLVAVWRSPQRHMERLMYDVRGWTRLSDADREEIRADVIRSLVAAADDVRDVTRAEVPHG